MFSYAGKEVNICVLNQLRRLYTEPRHEFVSLTHTGFGRLVFFQHDLKLKEVTQTSNPVEMDARSSNQKQRAVLLHTAGLTIGQSQRLSQSLRRGGGRA